METASCLVTTAPAGLRAGPPLMQGRRTIGLDLPSRALAWGGGAGKAWLTYLRAAELARRHRVTGRAEAGQALDGGLAGLARAAAAPQGGRGPDRPR